MAAVVPFTTPQYERDMLVSSYMPLLWLALVQAQRIDDGHPDTIAVRWLKDLAEAVGPLLRDADPETVQHARLYAEQAVSSMRQQRLPERAS